MKKKYLLLPRIEFSNANAQPAWWCVGMPGPSAFCGLAHALGRALNLKNKHLPVGIVWHDWSLCAEEIKGEFKTEILPHQFRAAVLIDAKDYAGSGMSLSGQPTVRGNGCVSLVFEIDETERVDPVLVDDFLYRARIAGGTISRHRFTPQKMGLYDSWEDLRHEMRSGFSFVGRMDLMEKAHESKDDEAQGKEKIADKLMRDPLDRFLEVTRHIYGEKSEESWLMPYVAGWLSITPTQERSMTRDGVTHAFVEPLIGIGQVVSLRERDIDLWSYSRHDERTYLLCSKSVRQVLQHDGIDQSEEAEADEEAQET